MSAAKVSVCIPTYNGAEFVAKAIESVLAQSFTDFELLTVDDCSNDATVDILRSFTDSRMRIDRNEQRLGIPRNWNHCLSLARGEYLCLFHQDDVMLPENLERKVQVLASDAAISFVHSGAEVLLEDSAPTTLDNWIEDTDHDFVTNGVAYFRQLFFRGNLICAPTVVARRQRLLDLGGFDEQLGYAPDYEMWMKACVEGRVAFLCRPLVLYRWHGHNASHAYRFERGAEEMLRARRQALQYYLERTERREEGEVWQSALAALTEASHRAAQLERYSESQQAYVKQLEQMRDQLWAEVQRIGRSWEEQKTCIEELTQARDRLWAEVQRIGRSWEEQKTCIEGQQRSIRQLEQMRDQLGAEVQRIGRSWEEQKTYVEGLEQERARLIAERERPFSSRLKRLARRIWRRASSV